MAVLHRDKVELQADGLKLFGEVVSPDRSGSHPALVLCHGIPGNNREPKDGGFPALAELFAGQGFVSMTFNFRGTGPSQGHLDILGWGRDLVAALDYLCGRDDVDEERVSVMGFSGGAVACIYVAAEDGRVSALVSCACPARIPFIHDMEKTAQVIEHQRTLSVSRDSLPVLTPEQLAEGFERADPLAHVARISPRPLLVLQGTEDNMVRPSQAQEIYDSAGQPRELVMLKGAGHHLRLEQQAMEIAQTWLKKVNGLS